MASKGKGPREKGKISLSRYFQEFKIGDKVSVIKELGVQGSFPKKTVGKTGEIESKRGNSYVVKINELAREKKFIIHPIHLERCDKKT